MNREPCLFDGPATNLCYCAPNGIASCAHCRSRRNQTKIQSEISIAPALISEEWEYPCRVCGKLHEAYEDPEGDEFDPSMHYCGGSPSCCP